MRTAVPRHAVPDGSTARRSRVRLLAAAIALGMSLAVVPVAAVADEVPLADPAFPTPVLILGECSATLSLVDLVPGRTYDIAVTDGTGSALYAQLSWVADAPVLDSFATVPVGTSRLVVTDVLAPDFQVSRPIDVGPCAPSAPGTATDTTVDATPADDAVAASGPSILVQPLQCDLLGATDVRIIASGLGAGTYTTGVTSGGSRVAGVADRRVTASSNTTIFPDLPNGGTYSVWLRSPGGSLVATAPVTLPICDLPTLDDPAGEAVGGGGVDERALANTGAPLPLIGLAGLAALQAGALAGGVALLRRRVVGRHAL